MPYMPTLKMPRMPLLMPGILLAVALCLQSCASKPPIVLTEFVPVDQPSAVPRQRVDPKFKEAPPSQLLAKTSPAAIRRLRNEGSHDNAAQIANLCLADFEALDIAFSDLVQEIDATDAADDTERESAAKARIEAQAEIAKLNASEEKKK